MSDTFLKIIPANPSFVPNEDSQRNAQNLLQDIYKSPRVELETTDEIEFVDQGSNFESVFCNKCGHEIAIEDWQSVMDECYETSFKNLIFQTSCCSSETSLNDLKYNWPAGFSKFCISIQNPDVSIDDSTLDDLQGILGVSLRLIWAHY